jgi:hypothetical protein
MKALMAILVVLPLSAQAPEAATGSSGVAASPVPATEPMLTGWIDLGYQWNTGVAGSLDTYRSIINLGSGPNSPYLNGPFSRLAETSDSGRRFSRNSNHAVGSSRIAV